MLYILNYCSECTTTGAFLASFITGCLTGTDYQRADLDKHLYGNPRSPCNGIFNVAGTGEALGALRSAALSGVSAVEPGGIVVGFYRNSGIADLMEYSGVTSGTTNTRKLILLPGDRQHGYPWNGPAPFGTLCAGCGRQLRDANGNC
jgi:hypothetical protein